MRSTGRESQLQRRVLLAWWQYMYSSVMGATVRARLMSEAFVLWIQSVCSADIIICAKLTLLEIRCTALFAHWRHTALQSVRLDTIRRSVQRWKRRTHRTQRYQRVVHLFLIWMHGWWCHWHRVAVVSRICRFWMPAHREVRSRRLRSGFDIWDDEVQVLCRSQRTPCLGSYCYTQGCSPTSQRFVRCGNRPAESTLLATTAT